jgi:hypothetical protein
MSSADRAAEAKALLVGLGDLTLFLRERFFRFREQFRSQVLVGEVDRAPHC